MIVEEIETIVATEYINESPSNVYVGAIPEYLG